MSNVSFLNRKQEGNTAGHPDGKIPHTAPVFVLNFDSVVGEFFRFSNSSLRWLSLSVGSDETRGCGLH